MEGHAKVEFLKRHGNYREGMVAWLLPANAIAKSDSGVVKLLSLPPRKSRAAPFNTETMIGAKIDRPIPTDKMASVEYLRRHDGHKSGDKAMIRMKTAFALKDLGIVEIKKLQRFEHEKPGTNKTPEVESPSKESLLEKLTGLSPGHKFDGRSSVSNLQEAIAAAG